MKLVLQLPVVLIDKVHLALGSTSLQQHLEFSTSLQSKYYPGPMLFNSCVRMDTGVSNLARTLAYLGIKVKMRFQLPVFTLEQSCSLTIIFVGLTCHYPVLDGFDQHFLLAAPLINLSNNDNFFLYKKIWNAGNQTRGSWVRKLVH